MLRKQCLLNDIFQTKTNNNNQEFIRQTNITKFVQCFNSTTGKRNRQIRILQIGGSCTAKINRKSIYVTQSVKKTPPSPNSVLLNNQILFKSHISYTDQIRNQCFFVQGVKKSQSDKLQADQIQYSALRTNKKKQSFNNQIFVSPTYPQKTRGWSVRHKNVQQLPQSFYMKNNHLRNNSSASPQKARHEQSYRNSTNSPSQVKHNKSSKSVNLLNKVNGIQESNIKKTSNQQTAGTNTVYSSQLRRKNNNNNIQLIKKNQQQLAEQQRKTKLQIKRQISLDYAKPFNPPVNISAFAYIVFEPNFSAKKEKRRVYSRPIDIYSNDINSGGNCGDTARSQSPKKFFHSHKVLVSQNSRTQLEVASLTKIMTCILALQLCSKYGIISSKQIINIGKFQSEVGGTTAQIAPGQIYTLEDLYYGLMLPSGNDASVAIAVWGGRLILTSEQSDPCKIYKKKQSYLRFILQMNNLAGKLGMQKTTYANSHGLVNPENKSCAYDLSILCEHAMNNLKFRQIVGTRVYSTEISYYPKGFIENTLQYQTLNSPKKSQKSLSSAKICNDGDDQILQGQDLELQSNQQSEQKNIQQQTAQKKVQWQNTHKLLQQKPSQYIGIKTGITEAAGPCLASCTKTSNNRYFIIIVLNCDKMSMRFKDTQNLKKWALQKEGLVSQKKNKKIIDMFNEEQSNNKYTLNQNSSELID